MLAIGRLYGVDMLARERDLPHAPAWDEVWAVVLADQADPDGVWRRVTGSPFAGWSKQTDVTAYLIDVIRAFGGMMSKDGAFFDGIEGYKRPVEVLRDRIEERREKDVVETSGDSTTYGAGANNSYDRDEFEALLGITESAKNPDIAGFQAMLMGLDKEDSDTSPAPESASEIVSRVESTGDFSDEDVRSLIDLVPEFGAWLDAALGPEGRGEISSAVELLEIYELATSQ